MRASRKAKRGEAKAHRFGEERPREAKANEATALRADFACKNHAWEFGIDPPEITNWQWPF